MICSPIKAKEPYRFVGMSVNIYTMEELCYCLTNYPHLVEDGIMNADLCKWISGQLKETQLANHLLGLIRKGVSTAEFVTTILDETGYLETEQLKKVESELNRFEEKTPNEKRKMRMDRLAQNKHYAAAIHGYEDLLLKQEVLLDSSFAGDICHNLGCCYSNLFLFDNAMKAFRVAYHFNKSQDELDLYQKAKALLEGSLIEELDEDIRMEDWWKEKASQPGSKTSIERLLQELSLDCKEMCNHEFI